MIACYKTLIKTESGNNLDVKSFRLHGATADLFRIELDEIERFTVRWVLHCILCEDKKEIIVSDPIQVQHEEKA